MSFGSRYMQSAPQQAQNLAQYGRHGDTMLAHITPEELLRLLREGGAGTINPVTGLPEFYTKDKETPDRDYSFNEPVDKGPPTPDSSFSDTVKDTTTSSNYTGSEKTPSYSVGTDPLGTPKPDGGMADAGTVKTPTYTTGTDPLGTPKPVDTGSAWGGIQTDKSIVSPSPAAPAAGRGGVVSAPPGSPGGGPPTAMPGANPYPAGLSNMPMRAVAENIARALGGQGGRVRNNSGVAAGAGAGPVGGLTSGTYTGIARALEGLNKQTAERPLSTSSLSPQDQQNLAAVQARYPNARVVAQNEAGILVEVPGVGTMQLGGEKGPATYGSAAEAAAAAQAAKTNDFETLMAQMAAGNYTGPLPGQRPAIDPTTGRPVPAQAAAQPGQFTSPYVGQYTTYADQTPLDMLLADPSMANINAFLQGAPIGRTRYGRGVDGIPYGLTGPIGVGGMLAGNPAGLIALGGPALGQELAAWQYGLMDEAARNMEAGIPGWSISNINTGYAGSYPMATTPSGNILQANSVPAVLDQAGLEGFMGLNPNDYSRLRQMILDNPDGNPTFAVDGTSNRYRVRDPVYHDRNDRTNDAYTGTPQDNTPEEPPPTTDPTDPGDDDVPNQGVVGGVITGGSGGAPPGVRYFRPLRDRFSGDVYNTYVPDPWRFVSPSGTLLPGWGQGLTVT